MWLLDLMLIVCELLFGVRGSRRDVEVGGGGVDGSGVFCCFDSVVFVLVSFDFKLFCIFCEVVRFVFVCINCFCKFRVDASDVCVVRSFARKFEILFCVLFSVVFNLLIWFCVLVVLFVFVFFIWVVSCVINVFFFLINVVVFASVFFFAIWILVIFFLSMVMCDVVLFVDVILCVRLLCLVLIFVKCFLMLV